MSHLGWLVAGAIFVLLEFLLPGGVAGAVGVATLLIGLFVWLGWLTSFGLALAIWTVLVVLSLLAMRLILKRFFPSPTSVGIYEEEIELQGSIVTVTEEIPRGNKGRILVRGTTWIAAFVDPVLSAHRGDLVRLVSRQNLIWYVEPANVIPQGENT
jgi:membrane protein implicated in regulation of membrane protease activity